VQLSSLLHRCEILRQQTQVAKTTTPPSSPWNSRNLQKHPSPPASRHGWIRGAASAGVLLRDCGGSFPPSPAMGNSLGCSASGERLVSAARDGDAVESRMLLELSPALARYSTFGGLNTPLHFAAAKGNLDVSVISSHAFLSFQRFRLI
jgi:hypothetical protein